MKKLLIILGIISSGTFYGQSYIGGLSAQELFGSIKARHIGPALMSGRVSDIEGHPTDSKIIYIGTAGGGVWKSSDGGVMFNSIFDKHAQSIGVVRVDPNDADKTIWVGTGETWTRNSTSVGDGIYKSTDGGTNWKKMGLAKSERISSILINPKNSDEIYVGVLGAQWGDSEERGVYKTIDGGKTWERIFYINQTTGCGDLIVDPNDFNTMYASFWEFRRTAWSFDSGGNNSALYKTIDGGKTWNKIHNGFPKGTLGRIGVALAPSNSKILYAVVESEQEKDKGLYKSEDAGVSWKHLNNDFALTVRPFYFSRIVVDPTNPDIITKAGLFGSISRDGGLTFKQLGGMHPDIHDIWFDIKDADKMFVATDGGLYRSLNKCVTMERIENLPLSQFYHISLDNEEPYNIYGGLQDNGSWIGPSSSPGGVEARDWESVGMGDGFRVFPHPTNSNIVYSEMQGANGVWRYDFEHKLLKVIKPFPKDSKTKLRFNWNASLSTSLNHPDRLYIGSQYLHVSDDRGDNWRIISPDLTTNDPLKLNQENSGGLSKDNSGAENHCTIFTVAESPVDKEVIWIGTDDGNIQYTLDEGKTWNNVSANYENLVPKNTWCYHIEADKFKKGAAFAVFDGHTANDGTAYLIRTEDYGKTWESLADSTIYGFARSFEQDIENPNLLFLGTEFGLYVSTTGGDNWVKFQNNMPSVAIHYMEMHPKTSDLVMGTHGRGVIIIDDLSPIRELIKKENSGFEDNLFFIPTKEFYMSDESNFGQTSTETQFVGANPSENAKIIYFLKKRHTFGKMSMEIQDANGKLVSKVSPGKRKGLNIVEWSFGMNAPKIAKGKTFDFGGFISPRVAEGKYKVVLKKGKETFETTLDIRYPKNSIFSLEERGIQQKAVADLFNLTEDLAYLVYKIDALLTNIKANEEDASLAKSGVGFAAELNMLKKTLVITSGDNYVGAADPELRENISNLFGVIAGYYGKPGQNHFENMKSLQEEFKEANEKFNSIQAKQGAKYFKTVEKAGKTKVTFKTREVFLED